jgi:uncharacterized protein (TIGR02246 family)
MSRVPWRVPVLVTVMVATAVISASAQTIPDWARERTAAWYNAFNSGNATVLAGMHAPDAVLLVGGVTMTGREAIQGFHAGQFAQVRFDCAWTIQGVSVVHRLAAIWGTDTCTETPKSGPGMRKFNGRFLTMYQLQADGSWMVIRDTGEVVP